MRKYPFVVLGVCLLLFGILVTLLPRPSRVTRANYDRIKLGMSRAEVEEILGGPPGDYRTGPAEIGLTYSGGVWMVDAEEWMGDEGIILIYFDDGEVCGIKEFFEWESVETDPLETLRWRLKRRWDRLWGRAL